jgi:hypothetical protein
MAAGCLAPRTETSEVGDPTHVVADVRPVRALLTAHAAKATRWADCVDSAQAHDAKSSSGHSERSHARSEPHPRGHGTAERDGRYAGGRWGIIAPFTPHLDSVGRNDHEASRTAQQAPSEWYAPRRGCTPGLQQLHTKQDAVDGTNHAEGVTML